MNIVAYILFLGSVAASPTFEMNDVDVTSEGVSISADHTVVSTSTNQATFTGSVRCESGGVVLLGQQMVVWYNGDGSVTQVKASGRVQTTRGQQRANADGASLNILEQKIVLRGNAVLKTDLNQMSGDLIVIDLLTDSISCEQCQVVVAPK